MRYLTVLRCLYDEYVCALAMRHEVSWPVNEYLKTVNNNNTFWAVLSEVHGKGLSQYIS